MRTFFSRSFSAGQPARSTAASKRNALLPWLLAVALALTAQQGWAQTVTCSLSVTGVSFGSYDVFSGVALDSTGNIGVNCASGVGYSIALSAGGGSFTQRVMANGTHKLNYNLSTDATRIPVWGDGTGGTAIVNGSGTGTSVNHGVYGRIPARQNATVGSYSDSIIVTVTF